MTRETERIAKANRDRETARELFKRDPRCPKCGGKLRRADASPMIPTPTRCLHGNCEWGWPKPDAEGRTADDWDDIDDRSGD